MSRGVAALIGGAAILLSECGAPTAAEPASSPAAGQTTRAESGGDPATDPATPAEPAVVDACPEPSEGADQDIRGDADGPDPAGPDPRNLTGPTTAVVSGEVRPITDEVQPELPVTVRSCDGVDFEVTDLSRIVTADLYGTLGEIVFTLGLGDHVVGRDTSMGFSQADDVPVITPGGHDLNAEAILELDPTLVLTDASIGPPEVQQQLRDTGIPVVFFSDSRTLNGVGDQIEAVAGVLGVPDVGERLVNRVTGEVTHALSLAPADADPLRATFLYIRGTAGVYLMSGPGSGADSLIEAIGAVDVGTDIGLDQPFTPLTSEALIDAAPDVIIMMTAGLESVGGVDGLLEIPGVAQTPAGQNQRIIDMNDSDLLNFGPRSGETIRALAEAVYQR